MTVQNIAKPRGRPRAYDPREALGQALLTFWRAGYSGTSLDDLSAAMGMNRPSLYAAFGDKKTLYLKAIETYCAIARAKLAKILRPEITVAEGLQAMMDDSIASYVVGAPAQRGCFMIGTAITESAMDEDVRRAINAAFREIETAIAARFRLACETGELPETADPAILGRMAADMLYGTALRARVGDGKAELTANARAIIAALCGLAGPGIHRGGNARDRGGSEPKTPA